MVALLTCSAELARWRKERREPVGQSILTIIYIARLLWLRRVCRDPKTPVLKPLADTKRQLIASMHCQPNKARYIVRIAQRRQANLDLSGVISPEKMLGGSTRCAAA